MEEILASVLTADAKDEAKKYINDNEIPRLFECMLTGLLHHRPSDPAQFVQDCLDSVRYQKGAKLRWNIFVDWKPPGSFNPSRSASAMVRPDSTASSTVTPRAPLQTLNKADDPFMFEEDSGIASALL